MTNFLKFSRYRAAKSDGYEPLVALQRIGSTDSVLENEGAKAHVAVASVEVDTGAQLVAGNDYEVDLMETRRIREKIDWHILPLMCTLYWIQFMDKTTLGSAAILGIREASHLTTNQYNWLGTVFYLSYLIFECPQNLALQRFPVGKWMSINIFIWGVVGACSFSMFYTRNEQTLRVAYWFLMNGTAQIISEFISFGTLHIRTKGFEPWRWLMVITGALTLITAVTFWSVFYRHGGAMSKLSITFWQLYFPDSPTNAWLLSEEERLIAIRRLKENQTGVENKHFKVEQVHEALRDPKTWLFALFSALNNVPNSLTNQSQIIVSSFGFTYLQTTLLGCVDGVIEIVTIWTGVHLAARLKDARACTGAVYFVPNLVGVLLIQLLPWSNRIGLLCGSWLTGVGTTGFVLSLSWLSNVTAGHTKRVTVNAIMLIAYCIGNAAGPFMWQERYRPRNRLPWAVIGLCYLACPIILLLIRRVLSAENRRRDMEPRDDTYDDVYIEVVMSDGERVERKVDKEFLDLTDIQNRDFRYVL